MRKPWADAVAVRGSSLLDSDGRVVHRCKTPIDAEHLLKIVQWLRMSKEDRRILIAEAEWRILMSEQTAEETAALVKLLR